MSFKENQKDITRRVKILARREPRDLPNAHSTAVTKEGKTIFIEEKQSPAYIKGMGTRMNPARKKSMLRRAIRRRLGDAVIMAVYNETATREMVYGFHPTKRRARWAYFD